MIKGITTTLLCMSALILCASPSVFSQDKNSIPEKADPAAWNFLKSASGNRELFPTNVAGCNADIIFNDNGKIITGKITYDIATGSEVTIDGANEEINQWISGNVNNILGHRRGGDFSKADGKNPITFGVDDGSPIGRKVELNDRLKSSYRINNNRVVEVDRIMGNDHFIINVIDVKITESGKFLPVHYIVNYFDQKSGAMTKSETYTDSYTKLNNIWLPVSRRIILAENNKITVRTLEFKNPKITLK